MPKKDVNVYLSLSSYRTRETAMLRRHFKQRDAFRKTASAHIKELHAALDLAVAAMDGPWSDLERGWLAHQQHLVEIGIRPTTGNELSLIHI